MEEASAYYKYYKNSRLYKKGRCLKVRKMPKESVTADMKQGDTLRIEEKRGKRAQWYWCDGGKWIAIPTNDLLKRFYEDSA